MFARIKHLCMSGILLALCLSVGCDSDDEKKDNLLGGETNLELTKEGNEFPISLSTSGLVPAFDRLKDSIKITRNDGGVVTVRTILKFDSVFVNALESELGIAGIPGEFKHTAIDSYAKLFSATLDTTDKNAMSATADLKFRITSEGIQGLNYAKGDLSKASTIVKYSWNVGDTYEYTKPDGAKLTRRVTSKSTTDDYPIGFWLLKVMKVEETKDDPLIEKITYIANHKYGLIGAILKTKAGKELKLTIFPPTL